MNSLAVPSHHYFRFGEDPGIGFLSDDVGQGEAPTVNDYNPIAAVFDDVMGYDFHAATHHLRLRVIEHLTGNGDRRCLDLCCGTGLFFNKLSESIPITGWGLDLSSGQIEVAKTRAGRPTAHVHYLVEDVTSCAFPEGIDLVSINFDALNHIRQRVLWRDIFRRVRRSIRKTGILLLDVNLPERLTIDWNVPEVIVKNDLTYIQLSLPTQYRDGGVIRRTPMIIFWREKNGMFVRRDALIEQFALPLKEILALLAGSGFSDVEVLQVTDDRPVGHIFNKHRAFLRASP